MAAKPTMLTAEGLKNLEEELEFLHNVKRKEIAEKIKVARSYGDLSENSEYDDAKNERQKRTGNYGGSNHHNRGDSQNSRYH